jgi:hypothetical protein
MVKLEISSDRNVGREARAASGIRLALRNCLLPLTHNLKLKT